MEFQFPAAGLDFQSMSHDWLVVAGARAQYRGSGQIGGAGDYSFIITVIDGDIGGGPDRFRMKLWNKVTKAIVYDNQAGAADASDTADPVTAIRGGSIAIHKG